MMRRLLATLLLALCLPLGQAWAALAIDTTASLNGIANPTLTWSHTTSGSNRALLVGCSITAANTISGVTYNSVAMTQVAQETNSISSSLKVYIFALIAPATGANNVIATASGTSNMTCGSVSFTGADQTTVTGTAATSEGTTSPATVTLSSAAGEIVIDTVIVNSGPTITPGGSQTQQWNLLQSSQDGGSTQPGAASVTMSWTFTNNVWSIAAIPVKPLGAGGARQRALMGVGQ